MKRNSRRAYDKEGREIEPMTLGGMRDARSLARRDLRWLRPRKCGSKDLHTMLCMPEYYQTAAIVRL